MEEAVWWQVTYRDDMTYDPISKPKPIQRNESLKKSDYLPYETPHESNGKFGWRGKEWEWREVE